MTQNALNEATSRLKISDEKLKLVIDAIGSLHVTQHPDPFIFLVQTIIGQMLSSKVKHTIYGRLQVLCNNQIDPHTIDSIDVQELRNIGMSTAKASCIKNLAQSIISGDLVFEEINILPKENCMEELKKIKGLGNWSAKMYLIFFLQKEDVLPYEDGAFLQSFKWLYKIEKPTIDQIKSIASKWHPYESIAARYLYVALDSGLTKKDL